jgi:hypothetical protein
MNRTTFWNATLTSLFLAQLVAACGDDGDGVDVTPDSGTEDGSSTSPDVITPDVDDEETTPDVGPDTDTENEPDTADATDGSTDAPDIDESACPGSIECFDERTGRPSAIVCLNNGFAAGSTCELNADDVACCVPAFSCTTDADCEAARVDEGFCADARFPCACQDDGSCATELCSSDSECGDGELCLGGVCSEIDATLDRTVRVLNRTEIVSPGTSLQMMGVAVAVDDARQTDPSATILWSSESTNVVVDAAGVATISGGVSITEVTGRLSSGDPGDSVRVVNVGPDTANLRLVVVDEATREPVSGAVAVVEFDDTAKEISLQAQYVNEIDDVTSAGAVHVFAPGYSSVSVIGATGLTLVIAMPPVQSAAIDEVRDGFVCNTEQDGVTLDDTDACGDAGQPPCLCYELQNVDVVRGVPDFTGVPGDGEVDVAVSGVSLGNSLLDLNFDLIVGPEITRIPPEDSPIPLDDEVGIPSGVSLYFNNAPFADSYIATAPAGERIVWTIGGKVFLSDVLVEILPSLGGDLAFGPIIAAVLPLFEDFYSGISEPVTLSSAGTFPVRDPGIQLAVPTQRRVLIEAPSLPEIATGFADTGIFLGGAIIPGEGFVPMGITGGTDVLGTATPDGRLDGDQNTAVVDPIGISMAPIHGAINTAWTQYMFALVALQLDENTAGPREATSGRLVQLPLGSQLPERLVPDDAAFPALFEDVTWDSDDRSASITSAVERPDLFRFVLQGPGGENWIVYTPGSASSFVLPAVPSSVEVADPAGGDRVNVVAITLRDDADVDFESLLAANGRNLTDLFQYIDGFSITGL